MNKISVYALIMLLSFTSVSLYSQNNKTHVVTSNGQSSDTFNHTIERGETVYAIATMYGVSVQDIYRLNPESKESIKAGSTLKIPQRDAVAAPAGKKGEDFLYHTIQPKETLYSLSTKYAVPATAIIDANPGLSAATFTIGKNIRIPATQIEQLPATEKKMVTKEIEYTIEKKETMYRICRKFNISSTELVEYNPSLKDGIKAGMVIKIPVRTEENVTETAEIPKEREVNALLSAPKDIQRVNMIKVAILLPFMADEAASASRSRFVEYYEGFLLAVDSLRNMGCSVELSVFDTGNGTKKIKEILKQDALSDANLIIGALENDQIGLVADFAQKNNIKYVIPFTSKNDDVLSNATVFQVNTPHSYLYAKAAQAGCDLFSDYNIIFLNIKDNEEKADFIKTFKSELKQRHISFSDLNYRGETFPADVEALLKKDKRNVIVPTSSSQDALNKIKSPLRMLTETKPEYTLTMFGYPEWQTYTHDYCLEDLHRLNTYIYGHFYADNLSQETSDFYTKYKTWYSKNLINSFPKYGILGFDTGMFFLGAINKYGLNFEENLDKIKYKSIQTGFDFQRVNNWGGFVNTNIFIIHYKSDFNVTRSEVR